MLGLTFGSPNANGCGPWWVPIEWKDQFFVDECNIHDQDYSEQIGRKVADKKFYKSMKQKISLEKKVVRYKRGVQAWAFYHIVRNLGWLTY